VLADRSPAKLFLGTQIILFEHELDEPDEQRRSGGPSASRRAVLDHIPAVVRSCSSGSLWLVSKPFPA
jgi:hypothetical protein